MLWVGIIKMQIINFKIELDCVNPATQMFFCANALVKRYNFYGITSCDYTHFVGGYF